MGFTSSQTVNTYNGVATAMVPARDMDLSIADSLMAGRAHLLVNGDTIEVVSKATDGMLFKRGYMVFPTSETRTNYLVDFGL